MPRRRSPRTSRRTFRKRHRVLYEVRDMAFRIAGTGSLGCLRIALLVRGKGKRDGEWIFDMKEEDADPSSVRLLRKQKLQGAERVESGMRAALASVPRGARTDQATRIVDARSKAHAARRQSRSHEFSEDRARRARAAPRRAHRPAHVRVGDAPGDRGTNRISVTSSIRRAGSRECTRPRTSRSVSSRASA